jgi:hypothetical protein
MQTIEDYIVFSSLSRYRLSPLSQYQAEALLAVASAFVRIIFDLHLHVTLSLYCLIEVVLALRTFGGGEDPNTAPFSLSYFSLFTFFSITHCFFHSSSPVKNVAAAGPASWP